MKKRRIRAAASKISATERAAIERAVDEVSGGSAIRHKTVWTEREIKMLKKMYRTHSALVIALKLKKPIASGAKKKLLGLTKKTHKKTR